jgi:hypothetical protein
MASVNCSNPDYVTLPLLGFRLVELAEVNGKVVADVQRPISRVGLVAAMFEALTRVGIAVGA